MLACWLHATDDLRGAQMVSSKQFCGALLVLAAAVLVAAKVDNIIHEVRFAEVYRHWSASETEKSIYVNAGDMILVRMNENPGTGYRWQLVTDDKDGFDQTLCQLQATSGFADGLYEPSTSTDGSDDKVVDGVARPYVPPGAGEWPYPYPWGDRRFDVRCTVAGSTVLKLRYKRRSAPATPILAGVGFCVHTPAKSNTPCLRIVPVHSHLTQTLHGVLHSWEERYSWESRLNVYVLANN